MKGEPLGWDEPPEAGYGYESLRRPCPQQDEPDNDLYEPAECEPQSYRAIK